MPGVNAAKKWVVVCISMFLSRELMQPEILMPALIHVYYIVNMSKKKKISSTGILFSTVTGAQPFFKPLGTC